MSKRVHWSLATLSAIVLVGLAPGSAPVITIPAKAPPSDPHVRPAPAEPRIRVEVATRDFELMVYEGERQVARFPASVGRDNAYFASLDSGPEERLVRRTHIIEPGNTLWSLSRKYGVDVWVLRSFNVPIEVLALRPGRRIRVPQRDVQLTPHGEFRVTNKTAHPEYWRGGERIPPFRWDRRNEFGVRWIGLSDSPYGIHGTNEPDGIGKFNTKGCVRLTNHDVARLFELVDLGTPVVIYYQSRRSREVTPS